MEYIWRIVLFALAIPTVLTNPTFTCATALNYIQLQFTSDPGRNCSSNDNNSVTLSYGNFSDVYDPNVGFGQITVYIYNSNAGNIKVYTNGLCFTLINDASTCFCTHGMPYISLATGQGIRMNSSEINNLYFTLKNLDSGYTVKWVQELGPAHAIPDNTFSYDIDPDSLAAGHYIYKVEVYMNAYSLNPGEYLANTNIGFYYGGSYLINTNIDGNVVTVTLDIPVYNIYIYIYI